MLLLTKLFFNTKLTSVLLFKRRAKMLTMQRFLTTEQIQSAIHALIEKYSTDNIARIITGINQVADLWREEDGDAESFKQFCLKYFYADHKDLDKLFHRLEDVFEQIDGHFHELDIFLSEPMNVELKEKLLIDELLSAYNPATHFSDDFFSNKLAFVVLLNFEIYNLETMLKDGANWSRQQWAEARLALVFKERIPASVINPVTQAVIQANDYVNEYNIYMRGVLFVGESLSTSPDKLSSHWGLIYFIKALYASPDTRDKQRVVTAIMNRVVEQSIPQRVVNNPDAVWDPYTDKDTSEACIRYKHLLNIFRAIKGIDIFYRDDKTYIDNKFNSTREIPERIVEGLIVSLASHPVAKDVGRFISNQLGRPLEAFDIWFNQFEVGQELSQLDAVVKQKYPTLEDLQESLPNILMRLGFNRVVAHSASDKIVIDPGRGDGHATGSERREGKYHLRIRFLKEDGKFVPNYAAFNTLMHELGHGVEMYFSIQGMDHNLLRHVPGTGFTEALAFVFQDRTQDVLGFASDDKNAEHLKVLELFWGLFEMAGVSLVDMRIWRFMYANPEVTPEQLRDAVVEIAKDVWNTYFAPVFGIKDQYILAIYSHIICHMLYIPDYFLGLLIQHQIQEYLKDKDLAKEVQRMYNIGKVTPDQWMRQAVGVPLSVELIIDSVYKALEALK